MNAPELHSDSGSPTLSEGVRRALRDAIATVYRDEARVDTVLRDALRHAAAEARERGLRPEELVIAIKALLDDLPTGDYDLPTVDRLRLRERIVSACIRAYFHPGEPPGR